MFARETLYYPTITGAERNRAYQWLRDCAKGLEIFLALLIIYGLAKASYFGALKPILPVLILVTCVCILGGALLHLLQRNGQRESPRS